ncbi:armadillo-type protein [Radiomyces spectabilis]|uniref:armadillo-type protein n=1 Tax=Radiomyces spectabilis TaxID=64574 RepID=UPI00222027CB|nr:armadillo-type protein [Radiomyces spectabilis]KAI8366801.1 armadillo-type protein [Radiomyces spectabilis]
MKDGGTTTELNTTDGANRFKYQSFNTRVERLKVDIVRRSRLVEDEIDEQGSFFHEALLSWKELNLTRHFKNFYHDIFPYAKSLPAIVYHKDKITEILETHLKVRDSMALDALLDLVTKLAKDLEGEFYPYYPRIFSCVLPLVYHRDVKLLESVFNCIAYLFKFLSRQILPDIRQTFQMLAKLLGEDHSTKPYIRHFTAEAFAFLMRKLRGKDLADMVEHILSSLSAEPSREYTEGLAMLLFECIKQVDHRLHSRGEAVYKELLQQTCQGVSNPDLDLSAVVDLLNKTTLLTLHHTYRQHFSPIINIVLNAMDAQLQGPSFDEKQLTILMTTVTHIVTVRKASRVEDHKPIINRVQQVVKLVFQNPADNVTEELQKETLRAATGLLCFGNLDIVVTGGRLLLDSITCCSNAKLVYGFLLGLAELNWPNFTQVALPYIVRYAAEQYESQTEDTILFLSQMVVSDAYQVTPGMLSSCVSTEGLLRFPTVEGKKTISKGLLDALSASYDWEKETDILNNTDVTNASSSTGSAITVISAVLNLIPHIQLSASDAFTALLVLFHSLKSYLTSSNSPLVRSSFVLGHKNYALGCLVGLSVESLTKTFSANNGMSQEQFLQLHDILFQDVLPNQKDHEVVLRGIFTYMDHLRSSNDHNELFSLDRLHTVYDVVKTNLSSYRAHTRLYTLKLLSLYDQPLMKKDEQHREEEDCEIVQLAVDMEEVIPTLKDYRNKTKPIQRLNVITSSRRTPDMFVDFVPRLAFGILTMNIRPVWDEARAALKTFSEVHRDLYWTLMYEQLTKFDDETQLLCDGFTGSVMATYTAPPEQTSGLATKTGNISFECPTYNSYVHTENKALSMMDEKRTISFAMLFVKLCDQQTIHMDFWNWYNLLLKTLKDTPNVTEQHSRDLIPIFFAFLEQEYDAVTGDDEEDDEEGHENSQLEKGSSNETFGLLPRSSKLAKSKLAGWLALFAAFMNPRVLYKSQQLHDVFMRLITQGDVKVQQGALECLLTWRDPNIKPYGDNMRNLLDDVKFRDELSTFIQNQEQNFIDPAHRDGLMPVVMRLLFGRLVQRRMKASAKGTKHARRKAILSAVACCYPNEIRYFIDLALEAFKGVVELPSETRDANGSVIDFTFLAEGDKIIQSIPWRKQNGVLVLIEDILKQMGAHIIPYMEPLLKVTLYIINAAQRRSNSAMDVDEPVDEEEVDANNEVEPSHGGQSKRSKDVRSQAMKRVVEFFKLSGHFNFQPYVPAMFRSFISPRMDLFAVETSQNVTPLLSLLTVWAEKVEFTRFLVDYDDRVIPQLFAVLSAKKVNEHVLTTVLTAIETILDHCDDAMEEDGQATVKEKLILPYVDILLSHIQFRLNQSKDDVKFGSGKYSVREIGIVARVASYTKDGAQAAVIIDLLLPSLKKPNRIIPEKTKEHILTIWAQFIRIVPGFELDSPVYHKYYSMASWMLSSSRTHASRKSLLAIFKAFKSVNPSLELVVKLLQDFNAYSAKRVEEPDYDRMLDALNNIGEHHYLKFNHHQWLPLLHQFVYCMHDAEEMAIRGSATHCMTQFLVAVKEQSDADEQRKMLGYVTHLIYPAIKQGLTERVELVRMEFVNLLNASIKSFPELDIFADMVQLLGDNDEEVNFFNNIYHMQMHRRIRSLNRLAEIAANGTLKTSSINGIFMPILSAFFYESDRVMDHNLIHQCIQTLSALAQLLPWPHYYRLLRYYLALISKKEREEMEKIFVRVVTAILDAFHFDLSEVEVTDEAAANIMGRQKVVIDYLTVRQIIENAAANEEAAEGGENDEDEEEEDVSSKEVLPKKTQAEKIHDILITKVLPELNTYLNNNKTRNSVVVRVPMALGIAKLIRALPERSMRLNLPGLLVSLCQIIRSRAQDVRDIVRETLLKINAFLGPDYFSFIVKELKTSLTRGYEMHVLGYTVNALIADTIPRVHPGQLDPCLEDIVAVLVNDIFGFTGQEKEADEMTGKTKEAKSKRSPASFELLATVVRFKNIGLLLLPFKDIMTETESLKILRKVDDLLKRVANGLVRNPEFDSEELLNFSYGLISENVDTLKPQIKIKVQKSQKEKNFEVQMKRIVAEPVDHYRTNAHRFVHFGLSLFYTSLRRNKFDLSSPDYVTKIDSFVDVVGNTLHSNQTANVTLAAKIMASLIRMPLPSVPEAVPAVVKRAFGLVKKSSGNTHSALVQACFKLLTICIRDINDSKLTEHQLTYLLNIIRPDMEEPDRQSTVFALIRAIISRKFMAPEVYDLMETVAQIMVTNQTREIREQARSVYFMFLMDYPQGRGRLKAQMSFIIKNLEYVYETGRESIMELMHHIINKFGDEILVEYAEPMFLALVMRLVNDDSSKCREMSAELIKNLMRRSEDRMETIYKLLDKWMDQTKQRSLQRAGCQVYGLVIDTFGAQFRPYAPKLITKLSEMLILSKDLVHDSQAEEEGMEVDLDWELGYYSINTFAKIAKAFPKLVYVSDTLPVWRALEDMLLHPHTWIRSSTARLYGVYFSHIDPQTRCVVESGKNSEYLSRATLRKLATKFIGQLKSVYLSEEQANQIVKNLFFIGKCFYYMPTEEDVAPKTEDSTEAEEAGNNEDETAVNKPSLNWLFRNASFTARGAAVKQTKEGFLLRASIFKWFAAMCNAIETEELGPYLLPVIAVIYRTVNDEATKEPGFDELKQLGNEVLNLVQKKAGPTAYFATYQQVREKVKQSKLDRKSRLARQAVVDPAAAARRKRARTRK